MELQISKASFLSAFTSSCELLDKTFQLPLCMYMYNDHETARDRTITTPVMHLKP